MRSSAATGRCSSSTPRSRSRRPAVAEGARRLRWRVSAERAPPDALFARLAARRLQRRPERHEDFRVARLCIPTARTRGRARTDAAMGLPLQAAAWIHTREPTRPSPGPSGPRAGASPETTGSAEMAGFSMKPLPVAELRKFYDNMVAKDLWPREKFEEQPSFDRIRELQEQGYFRSWPAKKRSDEAVRGADAVRQALLRAASGGRDHDRARARKAATRSSCTGCSAHQLGMVCFYSTRARASSPSTSSTWASRGLRRCRRGRRREAPGPHPRRVRGGGAVGGGARGSPSAAAQPSSGPRSPRLGLDRGLRLQLRGGERLIRRLAVGRRAAELVLQRGHRLAHLLDLLARLVQLGADGVGRVHLAAAGASAPRSSSPRCRGGVGHLAHLPVGVDREVLELDLGRALASRRVDLLQGDSSFAWYDSSCCRSWRCDSRCAAAPACRLLDSTRAWTPSP